MKAGLLQNLSFCKEWSEMHLFLSTPNNCYRNGTWALTDKPQKSMLHNISCVVQDVPNFHLCPLCTTHCHVWAVDYNRVVPNLASVEGSQLCYKHIKELFKILDEFTSEEFTIMWAGAAPLKAKDLCLVMPLTNGAPGLYVALAAFNTMVTTGFGLLHMRMIKTHYNKFEALLYYSMLPSRAKCIVHYSQNFMQAVCASQTVYKIHIGYAHSKAISNV